MNSEASQSHQYLKEMEQAINDAREAIDTAQERTRRELRTARDALQKISYMLLMLREHTEKERTAEAEKA